MASTGNGATKVWLSVLVGVLILAIAGTASMLWAVTGEVQKNCELDRNQEKALDRHELEMKEFRATVARIDRNAAVVADYVEAQKRKEGVK